MSVGCLPSLLSAGEVSYRYFRFDPVELRNETTANSVQLAEFEMRYQGVRITGASASNPEGNNPINQTPDKAVDEDVTTKWLDFNKGDLILDFGTTVTADAYAFTTAGDATERDPVSWQLLGSDNGTDWTTIDLRIDYGTTTSRQTEVGPFTLEASSYSYVRETLAKIASDETPIPDDITTIYFFSDHKIDRAGRTAMRANFDRDGDGIGDASSMLYWETGEIELIEKTEPITVEDQYRTIGLGILRINANGLMAYEEEVYDNLEPYDEYGASENRRLMLYDPTEVFSNSNPLELVRESDQIPGYPDYVLRNAGLNFNDLGQPLTSKSIFNNQGEIAFMARGENSATGDIIPMLFVASVENGLEVRVAVGESSPIEGTVYDFFESDQGDAGGLCDLDDNGRLLFEAGIDGTGIDTDNNSAAFLQEADGTTTLLKQEASASSQDDDIDQILDLHFADDGSIHMLALDSSGGSFEIWTNELTGGALEPVVESSTGASRIPDGLGFGSNARLERLYNIRYDSDGQWTFFAEVEEDSFFSPSSLGEAVFRWNDGQLSVVMDEDTVVDGLLSGSTLETAFGIDKLRINGNGTVLVAADVAGTGERALVAFPASGGSEVLLETSTYASGFPPENAGLRQVAGFTELSSFSDSGRVVLDVFLYPDGRALYEAKVGALNESTLGLSTPRISSANDELELNIKGLPNKSVTLESSLDLQTWTVEDSFRVEPDGYIQRTLPFDPQAEEQKFYQVVGP